MSSLPLRFLASWQAKQFSLRMGATSLMKLSWPFGAASCARAVCGLSSSIKARINAVMAQRTQTHKRERSMEGLRTGGIAAVVFFASASGRVGVAGPVYSKARGGEMRVKKQH